MLTRRALAVGSAATVLAASTVAFQTRRAASSAIVAAGANGKPTHGTYDVAVVGGGIVGLATAREIRGRFPNRTVVVLEKEAEVSLHQSGHNSGVIHAGMYYQPGSTMARLCVKGADMIYSYCNAKGIPAERVGKLICAPTANDAHHLETLLEKGNANGVKDLEIIDGARVRELEPNVVVHSALLSPNTGVVDYGVVSRQMARELTEDSKAGIELQFEVKDISLVRGGDSDEKAAADGSESGSSDGNSSAADTDGTTGDYVVVTGVEPGQPGPLRTVRARHVITCAGLHADTVAKRGGGARKPAILTFRGTYWQMKPEYANICKMNIYPTPTGGGIPVGVHFTPTVNERRGRQMIIGPGACITLHEEGYGFFDFSPKHVFKLVTHIGLWRFVQGNWRFALDEVRRDIDKQAFLDEARKLIPSVTDEMVEESFVGVMAQLFEDDGTPNQADFIFERKALDGHALHVRSTPSPACTASMAIAEDVVALAAKDFGWGQGREKIADRSPFWE
eukprot:UC1_evm1s43